MNILFFGITQFTVRGLKKLIQLGHAPKGMVITPIYGQDIETLKIICRDHNIPVYCYHDINDPSFLKTVREEIKPELLLTYTFSQKISPELISTARWAINMHPSYLPHYRGNNPYFWTLANGETETGVSFHYLTDSFDAGDIIYQEKIPIQPYDTCGTVIAKQEVVAAQLLEKIIFSLEGQEALPRQKQPAGDFAKAPKPTLKDSFIDWHWPTQKILNRIRALNPYSGAYTQYKQVILAIYEAKFSHFPSDEKPGTIVAFSSDGPVIKTGDGSLLLQILTVGKKYLLSGNDFIEYEHVKIGDTFIQW